MSEIDLIAIGPDLVFEGELRGVDETEWLLQFRRFVRGDLKQLVDFIDRFERHPRDRYVLVNALGDGRVLSVAPTFSRNAYGFQLRCTISRSFPRTNAEELGSQWAVSSVTKDMFLDSKKNIARVSGFEALPQLLRQTLSAKRGESPFHPEFGSRIGEYFDAYRGTEMLGKFIKLDVIRLAAIPYQDKVGGQAYTPLRCVERVRNIEVLSETLIDKRLVIRLDLDVAGIGRWRCELPILGVFEKVPRHIR
jgi:hypothetical protein